MDDIKLIASDLPIESLVASIDQSPTLWNQITARQLTCGSPHSDTETIFLRWCKDRSIPAVFNDIEAVDYPALDKLPESIVLIEQLLTMVGSPKCGRVILVKLKPGGYVPPHVDEGSYADHYERFHISLQSDEGNIFLVNSKKTTGEFAYMKPGEAWWFNHKKYHSVINLSSRPRIHLIVDAVAPIYRKERYDFSA